MDGANGRRTPKPVVSFFKAVVAANAVKPTAREALQGHPCVPLFTVQRDEPFLRQFYDDPDSVLSLTVSVGLFISIKAECLKLEATHSSELSVRTSVQSEISGSEMMIGRSP